MGPTGRISFSSSVDYSRWRTIATSADLKPRQFLRAGGINIEAHYRSDASPAFYHELHTQFSSNNTQANVQYSPHPTPIPYPQDSDHRSGDDNSRVTISEQIRPFQSIYQYTSFSEGRCVSWSSFNRPILNIRPNRT